MKIIKKYWVFILATLVIGLLLLWNRELGLEAVDTVKFSFKEMFMVLPPIFILLGLLDVWVPKDTMVKYMGEGSGVIGILLAFLLGSAAAGPLYGAFPVAGVFMKKGVKLSNILIFIGAWSTTKLPLILFELASMGPLFTFTRFMVNIPGILLIAYIVRKSLSEKDIELIYENASKL